VSVLIAGLTVSLLLFTTLRARDLDARRLGFERDAHRLANALQGHFTLALELASSVATLFTASESVSRLEFRLFTREILASHPSVYAFEWMPLVPDERRAALAAAARADGLDGFEITQKDASGRVVVAGRRPEYMPILFMEPLEPVALGLDVIANPERTTAPQRARAAGRPFVSERYSLLEDPPDLFSVLVYVPAYGRPAAIDGAERGPFIGLVGILLRIRPVVEHAIAAAGEEHLVLRLVDTSAPPAKQVLYVSAGHGGGGEAPPGAPPPGADTAGRRPALTWTADFEFADRIYRVHLEPGPGSPWRPGRGPWLALVGGLLVSGLLAAGAGATHVIRGLRHEVDAARRLGQYTLVRELGRGGMGRVYEARHRLLARPAAIKLIDPRRLQAAGGVASPEATLGRFEREAQTTARLCSQHTIRIYDFGRTDDGAFYYVMELLDGIDLDHFIAAHGPQDAARVAFILRQICHSLAEAHEAGMVHRDIKPANIFLCRYGREHDFVKVLDFGLVRDRAAGGGRSTTQTERGVVIGTPDYMAPELALDGGAVDGRADLYALGCVGYFLLTGTPVFAGTTAVAVLAEHVASEVEAPSRRAAGPISEALERVILDCLAKSPAERPASADALSRRLAACPEHDGWSWDDARRWWETHEVRPQEVVGGGPPGAPSVRID
jgi:serine/threonine protein kinase/CHASE1-domain containing sensor protein